ncbi:hypothetical protein VMT65_29095 [Nocardia sp. CDC153]|uniref:hypothetical protein n=1 Tax=Nocardia sp. CDC153 TaxID=3112167 RepID=UPI002DB90FFA|nr:hypothetical protein [Nocardia sp. CDC153]MEC3957123.1 hypothetical protein [Nocardia sp. CDC153]
MTNSDTITGLLVSAVERAWAAIRSPHPDVSEVVLTVAPDRSEATSRWGRSRRTDGHVVNTNYMSYSSAAKVSSEVL